jgi:hypothetical protein
MAYQAEYSNFVKVCTGCKAYRKTEKPCTKEGKICCVLDVNNVTPLPENADAWDVFQACSSSWNTSMAGVVGLDYSAVRAIAEAMNVEWTEDLFRRIKYLESEQLQHLNKK